MLTRVTGVLGGILIASLFTGCIPPPVASFTATPASGASPLSVTFTDTSTSDTFPITRWYWNFGDGTGSEDQNPTHIYTAAGYYSVTLWVHTTGSLVWSGGNSTTGVSNCVSVTGGGASPVWYVKPNATGLGTSWADAFGSIQNAADAASAGGGGEVWVAAGVYTGTGDGVMSCFGGDNCVIEDCTISLRLGVSLYGGFDGTETSRDARDWVLNRSIIDGEGKNVCVCGASGAVLDGFILQNGHSEYFSGGLYNEMCSPVIVNCVFSGMTGKYGAAVGNFYYASPYLINCVFSGNTSEYGSVIDNSYYSSPTLLNCTFN